MKSDLLSTPVFELATIHKKGVTSSLLILFYTRLHGALDFFYMRGPRLTAFDSTHAWMHELEI